ncbi:hypothetical protein GOBAR_DD19939 [Gossypium barbadense]|nr:hypothetical protein GOBAR_DD19939 [Gossypium barbadense]
MFGVTTLVSAELVGLVRLKVQIVTPPTNGCSGWNTSSRSSPKLILFLRPRRWLLPPLIPHQLVSWVGIGLVVALKWESRLVGRSSCPTVSSTTSIR